MSNPWLEVHQSYATRDWSSKPSLFAEQAIGYFPSSGRVLDLGCGLGQDSKFFADRGYDVVGADLELTAFTERLRSSVGLLGSLTGQTVDLGRTLPFEGSSFDVVYAHLSLHYFDSAATIRLFEEIERVLKPLGVLAFLVNSTTDPEYGTGVLLEPDLFHLDNMDKRYFSVETARAFASAFTELVADDQGETYKDRAQGIHNLIRFIGVKPDPKSE